MGLIQIPPSSQGGAKAVGGALPVVVPVAQGPDRNFESLPHWIQRVLHHLCLMANGESET